MVSVSDCVTNLVASWHIHECCHVFVHPVYKQMEDAIKNHPDADVLVNFASLRSAYESTEEAMQFSQVYFDLLLKLWNLINIIN